MAVKLAIDKTVHDLDILQLRPDLKVAIEGREYRLRDLGSDEGVRTIEINGQRFDYMEARDGNTAHIYFDNRIVSVDFVDPIDAAADHGGGTDEIRAPMPGVVIGLQKGIGDAVRHGETVVTIESMKLQTNLAAPRDGVIASIKKATDETFEKDEVIVSLEPEDDE